MKVHVLPACAGDSAAAQHGAHALRDRVAHGLAKRAKALCVASKHQANHPRALRGFRVVARVIAGHGRRTGSGLAHVTPPEPSRVYSPIVPVQGRAGRQSSRVGLTRGRL